MPKVNKPILKLAIAIKNSNEGSVPIRTYLSTGNIKETLEILDRIDRARRCGWDMAADYLTREDLARYARYAINDLAACRDRMEKGPAYSHVAMSSIGDIYHDIMALYDEFDDRVEFDMKGKVLSVTTNFITLEGVGLGRFKIQLFWESSEKNYNAKALDPNPASGGDRVTHPHVSGGDVCEGEGSTAVKNALKQNRLLDFFLLVNGILHSYNEEDAHITLGNWDGISCVECGNSTNGDCPGCTRCDAAMCDECGCSCYECCDMYCSECIQHCDADGCENYACRFHLKQCHDCSDMFCSECLTEERCPDCHELFKEKQKEIEEAESDDNEPDESDESGWPDSDAVPAQEVGAGASPGMGIPGTPYTIHPAVSSDGSWRITNSEVQPHGLG